MEKKDFDSISYDYYSNTSSYVKLILDMLPESKFSMQKKQAFKELYNYFLNHYDDEKINEISVISSMFREKLSILSLDTIARDVEYICVTFLDKIIFDSTNRDKIFNIMNETMKVYVGYYSIENNYSASNTQNYYYTR